MPLIPMPVGQGMALQSVLKIILKRNSVSDGTASLFKTSKSFHKGREVTLKYRVMMTILKRFPYAGRRNKNLILDRFEERRR